MINISQQEFESYIQELIDGKISRVSLAKKLKTDFRTLNNKIQELSAYNPDLYVKFITKFPYKSKSRTDIDFEALIIETIKHSMHTQDIASKYNVGERTIRRKVAEIKKFNPDLIELYNVVKINNRYNKSIPEDLKEKIDQLVERPVIINEPNYERKKHLEEIEKIFNTRTEIVGKEEAARSMGTTANRIYKLLMELNRIKIEEEFKNKDDNFIESLKVETSIQPKPIDDEDDTIKGKKLDTKKGVEK